MNGVENEIVRCEPLGTIHVACVGIESHQFDRLVVAARGDQVSSGTPRQTINRALVVFCPLEENSRLVRAVIVPTRQTRNR